MTMELLNTSFYDNTLSTWLIALLVAVVTAVVLRILKALGGAAHRAAGSADRDYLG